MVYEECYIWLRPDPQMRGQTGPTAWKIPTGTRFALALEPHSLHDVLGVQDMHCGLHSVGAAEISGLQ